MTAETQPKSLAQEAYEAWDAEAREHVGAMPPWESLPKGIKNAWNAALERAFTVQGATDWEGLLKQVAEAFYLTEMPLDQVPAFLAEMQRLVPKNETLEAKIASALNSHSAENGSNTPDFILAQYLLGCLDAWNKGIVARAKWYGVPVKNSVMSEADGALVEPVEPVSTFCPECGLPQWRCPSGLTCDKGHGY